jgi:hypothetical protein
MRRSKPVISALFLSLGSNLTLFMRSALRSRTALVAENLFLREQLAFYREHKARPRPLTDAARLSLVFWSRLFEWKDALVIVKQETLIGWHRKGFKLFWRWKSRPGRPPLPGEIRELIARMARENPTWGQVRVAAELSLSLASKSHLALSGSTGRMNGMIAAGEELPPNTGRRSCAIMRMPWSRVISWLRSRPGSSFFAFSSS